MTVTRDCEPILTVVKQPESEERVRGTMKISNGGERHCPL